MATLDDQTLGDVLSGYDTYKLPTAADAILTGNFNQLLPPQVANAISIMGGGGMGPMGGMGAMPGGAMGGGVPQSPSAAAMAVAQSVGTTGRNTSFYNASAADAGMMSPYQAQSMAYGSGQQAMNLPNPIYNTPANMGVFRPEQPRDLSSYIPNIPDFRVAGAIPPVGTMNFHTAESALASHQAMSSLGAGQQNAAYMNKISTGLFRGAAGTIGGVIGAGVGAYATGGTLGGAWTGWDIGSAAGELGASYVEKPFVAAMNFAMKPALLNRARSERMRMSSRNFVGGGQNLDPTGRGLSVRGAAQLNKGLSGLADESFNKEDVLSMTQMAGSSGILDMAQNPDQMVREMKKVIKAVGVIAKVTGDPDVKEAMKHIAEMKQFGASTNEAAAMYSNARTFARMAGVTTQQVISGAGLRGADTAQQSGLTAAAGVSIGVGAAGIANQAVGTGVFSAQELALAGGKSGLEQRITQGITGTIMGAGTQLLPALVSFDAQGNPHIDPKKLEEMKSSPNLRQFIGNVHLSPDQLMKLQTNQPLLMDTMARKLGPEGGLRMIQSMSGSLMDVQKGLSRPAAFMQLGASAEQASAMNKLFRPEVLAAIRKQHHVSRVMDHVANSKAREGERGYYGALFHDAVGSLGDNFRETLKLVYDPLEESLVNRKQRMENEASGLNTYTFGTVGGGQKGADFRLKLQHFDDMGGPLKARKHFVPSYVEGESGEWVTDEEQTSSSVTEALRRQGKHGDNSWLWRKVGSWFDRSTSAEVKRGSRRLEDVAHTVRTGMNQSAGDNAKTVLRLTKSIHNSKDLVKKMATVMLSSSRASGATGYAIRFGQWKSDIEARLNKDPGFKDKPPKEKESIVNDLLSAASAEAKRRDPDLARQAQKEIDSVAGFVSSTTLSGEYDTYEHNREGLLGLIGSSTSEDHWYGTRNEHSKTENEGTARKILGLGTDLGGPKEALSAIEQYQKYQRDRSGSLERGEITPEQVQKMSDLVKKHGLTKVFRSLNKKDDAGAATAAVVTGSFKLGAADTRKALITKLQATTKEVIDDNASDEDLKDVMRRHAKDLGISDEELKSGDALGVLADKLGVEATVTGEGEGITSTGERLTDLGKGSEEIDALKSALETSTRGQTAAAENQITASGIMINAATIIKGVAQGEPGKVLDRKVHKEAPGLKE